jgi:hypothetical protein
MSHALTRSLARFTTSYQAARHVISDLRFHSDPQNEATKQGARGNPKIQIISKKIQITNTCGDEITLKKNIFQATTVVVLEVLH